MTKTIRDFFAKFAKPNVFVCLLFDGYMHYWSGNVFTTRKNAQRWAREFNKTSDSVKVLDIVGVKTKDVHYFVNLDLNPEMREYAEKTEREIFSQNANS